MHIRALRFENYKPFEDAFEIEFKPLTILLGRNGSGKSSIIKLIPLFLSAFTEDQEPGLPFKSQDIRHANEVLDFFHGKRPYTILKLGISLHIEGADWDFDISILTQPIPGKSAYREVIRKVSLRSDKDTLKITKESGDVYKIVENDQERTDSIEWAGVLPKFNIPLADTFRSLIKRNLNKVIHLGAMRQRPASAFSLEQKSMPVMAFDGRNAGEIFALSEDFTQKRVQKWFYQASGETKTLKLDKTGKFNEILLQKGEMATRLSEAGEGMGQVFPIVVQRLIPIEGAHLEIFEEPEFQLHPNVHTHLADLFWQGLGDLNEQAIVETHSELFCLRMRRAIAEGWVSKDAISMIWVDDEDPEVSEIEEIVFDENGIADNWPEDLFKEDYHEALAIHQANEEREPSQ